MRVVILTVVLATVLGVDAKHSARTKRNACTGEPDGTFVADDASCSNFFVCYNGEAVVQSCNRGSYFNSTNSYCLPDTQNICPQAQPQCAFDGEFIPNPTECSQFYVCSGGELVKQSCLSGSYFDSKNLYCVPDTNNTCPPPPECSENGAYSPHPSNCSMFYVCYNGTQVEQSCNPGSYFNKTNLYCVPDTNNECTVTQCTEEGEFIPHPTQCDLFYVCYNGQLVEQTCGSGSYFNKTDLYCTPDSENICWPLTPSTEAPCTCVGGYTNGQFIAKPDSCYSYYVCSGGELLEQNCGYGNYFDNDKKVCERDKDGSCWPTTTSTTTTAPVPCQCAGGYEEGDLLANSDSCHSYFVCTQGQLIAQSCGTGNYFDGSTKSCARDENGSCWPTTTSTTTTAPAPCQCAGGYEEGDLLANSDSCHSYFVCTQGQLIAQSCGTGNYFDGSTKSCARDENGSCWPTTTSTTTTAPAPCQCAGGYEEGDLLANSDSCHSYFVCTQGQLIAQSCGTGNYFDGSTKSCARDENGSCWPTTTSTTTTAPAPCQCAGGFEEGDLLANSDSCHSYFVCTQGQLIAQSCGTGNYFDGSTKSCARDENGSCWPTTTSTTTTAPAPCQCAGGYEEGDLLANSDSCHSFFVCTQGQLIAQSCGTGNYFDGSTKSCARDENGSCWPTTTSTTTTTPAPCQCAGGYEEGDLLANSDNCSSFFICSQGKLVEQDCGSGNYFDATSKNCVHDVNGTCQTKCPGGYGEGELVANSDNCSSFFICSQGKLVEQDCGSGNYFDATSKNCIHDENGICNPTTDKPSTCPDGYEDGELFPYSGSCFKFYICFNGELLEKSCHQGNYFDSISKSCVVDETGVCWPIISTPSTPSTSKTTESALTPPSSSSTSSTKPPSTKPPSTKPPSTKPPSTKPPSTEPSTATPYTSTPSSESTSPTTDVPCSCSGGYEDGELIPYHGSCFKFYICFKGELVEESCHQGNYFDSFSKTCVVDETGMCWPIISTPSTSSTSKTTESTLTPTTASTSSKTPSSTKPSTATPSTTKSTTTSTTESSSPTTLSSTTDVPCSCPGGYEDGELIPYHGSCFKFYICFKGELVEESCHQGNYFDSFSKTCVVDETGMCWPIISTPSTSSTSKTTESTLTPTTASTSSITPSSTKPSTATPSTTKSTTTSTSESSSPTTLSSTTDVPCSCPGGYEDGELIPYHGSCFKFYICFKGELVEESCHQGNYFDSFSKTCVVDETGMCWPIISTPSTSSTYKTTESTLTPSTASTSSITPSSTKPSTATPSTTKSTTTSTTESSSPTTLSSTTDVPCFCPGGYEDGELIPYHGSCFKFFICFKGELVEESCHQGNYFDSFSKTCVVDETGMCWPIISTPSTSSTSKTTESTLTPSTASTASITPSSTKPSTATPSTTKSTTTSTTESSSPTTLSSTTDVPCSCPGGYDQGEFVPYSGKCYKFYICFNGELLEESCGQGNYFDNVSKSCVRDKTGVCWPLNSTTSTTSISKTTASATTSSTIVSSSTSPTPSSATPSSTKPSTTTEAPSCTGGYVEGELVAYPGSCDKYYICFSGELLPKSCGEGTYFDAISQSCVIDETGVCSPIISTPSTTSTSKTSVSTLTPSTASTSTIASSSTTPSSTKPSTATPSTTKSTTTSASEASSPTTLSSTTDVPCSCPGGYDQGEFVPYPGSCYKFYICFNGELLEESCGHGNYFNSILKSCFVDKSGGCWPVASTPSTTTEAKTTNSTTTSSSSTPSTASSIVPSKTSPVLTTPSSTRPTSTTPSTTADSTTVSPATPSTTKKFTTTEAPCTCSGGYADGEFLPHPDSCYLFYVCYQSELVEVSCGFRNYFDKITKSCVLDTTGICWSKTTSVSTTSSTASTPRTCAGGYEDGDFVPNPESCSGFYICYEGELNEMSCQTGNYFDNSTKSCALDTTGICWPKTTSTTTAAPRLCPNGYQNGQIVPNPTACYMYYICIEGDLIEGNCGTGNYFNNATNACDFDAGGCCWPSLGCPNGLQQGQLTANPSSCNLYSICHNGQLLQGNCGAGNFFNTATNACEADSSGTCSQWNPPFQPQPPSNGCNGLQEGQFSSSPSACYLYNVCHNGQLLQGNCGAGNFFNTATNACEADSSGKCSPWNPPFQPQPPSNGCNGLQEGQFSSSPSACYLYNICHNGQLLQGNCGAGNFFNTATNACEADSSGKCSQWNPPFKPQPPSYGCNGLQEGQFSSSPSACYLYNICHNGQLLQGNCGAGNFFNTATNACEADSSGKCSQWNPPFQPQPPSNGCNGLQEGQFSSSPSACYLYNICHNGQLLQGNCGAGNFFNTATNACEADSSGKCSPWNPPFQPQPPSNGCNGLQEGQFSSSPSACYLYNICHNGQLLQGNCGAGNFFNTATNACEADSSGKCSQWNPPFQPQPPSNGCNGLQEGQFSSSPSACYLYNVCHNGQLLQGNCGAGNFFNTATNACEADSSGKCSPWNPPFQPQPPSNGCNGLQEGQFSSSPSACYLYNICHNGQLLQGNCGAGNFFNTATNACEADSSGTCSQSNPPFQPQPPSNGCNGLQEGQFSSSPSACYLYNVCHNGQLVEGTCGTGNFFNSATNVCETDSSGNCWQSQPPSSGCSNGMQEGQFTPNPSSCYMYNICFSGQILQGTCGTGNYFNGATKICETDTTGSCWPLSSPSIPQPPSSGCPNGMQEGQFTPNPSSCYLYNICYNGQLLQGTCGTGNYFNSSTNTCNVDTGGCCWPLNPPVVPEPEPCACPNGLQEGQFTSNPTSCYLYNICHNGELIEGNCGTGNYFNNATNICETDTGGCCWPSNAECPGGYANGDFVPDPTQCDKFLICYQGALVPQDCGVGYFFDIFNNYCSRDINGTCWAVPTPNNTCDGVADGTFIINETFCDKYFVCYNNTKIGQECGTGNYFNSETLTCVRDTLGTCWKKVANVCANVATGSFVANPSNCQEFFVCHQNRAVVQQCSDGNWFNPQLLVCQPDLEATCVNVCRGTEGPLSLPHPKCNQFYLCANGLTTRVGTCSRGTNFNETLGICLASTICAADLCVKSRDGAIYPVQSDLASFYLCENRIPVKHSCPDGASFDPERLICIPDTGRCIGQKNGFAVASYNNPNAYYVCKNNIAIFAQCPSYAIFDEKSNICVQAGRRRLVNNKCAAEPDGTMLPGDACNEYLLCLDGEDIAQNCGAYSSFNKELGHCTLNLTCFNEAELCAKSSDTESFPDARYENVFYKCKRGLAVKDKCPKNMVYSHDIGYCVPKELAISSEELDQLCENVSDNTMAPAMDCRKFYICSNNVAILQQCASDQHFGVMTGTCLPDVERQCWMRSETLRGSFFIKTVCHEGHVRKHATDCARYEICADGVWAAELCPARHLFDSASQVCVPGDAEHMCSSARSSECSDDMPLRASDIACTDYYRCQNNYWRAAKCPIGEFFSGKMSTCTNDVSECARSQKIRSVGEKHCVANETRADELNCGLFHVCHKGEWWYRFCDEGSYFNRSLAVCTPNDGTCRSVSVPGPCRNGTVKKSDYEPCIVYHLCVDGNWTTQHCPAEHYFDETRKACMLDDGQRKCQNDIKNTSSSCKDGDRRFHSSNCKAFDICSFGNWLSVTCRSEFYFDTSLKICMPNRGECSVNGLLRQVCVENTSHHSPGNCSEFYYCSRGKWQLESCLQGFQYNATIDKCIPANSSCETSKTTDWMKVRCAGLRSGSSVAHEFDCTKYYLCVDDLTVEADCSAGRFFDNESRYCELNNGACPLKMATDENLCQGTSNGSHVQNPANCTTFYICTDTLSLLSYCPPEQYFNAEIGACQFDTGICNKPRLCDGNPSGRLPHETYCNIYYSCVRGMAIPVACEDDHIFEPTTRNCTLDTKHRCVDGILVGDEVCAQGEDGRPLVDSDDCTKYVMCTNGMAQTLQCPPGKFFDSNVMKCIPDNGSCPFVDGPDLPKNNTFPPDPITCIGKHGFLMPHPVHCNEWYVCIYGNLRHERCFDGEFFDLNTYGCSPMVDDEKCPNAGEMTTMCVNREEATSYADQTDCRKYHQCIDGELQSKKCRNGESFDTLLGFCRQNDGTCLLENGQRVGACAGKHGKLAADSENCRGYFTCINGQKISEECDHGEYFVKLTSRCEKDVNSTCRPIEGELTNATQLSCDSLNELLFYPNVIDGCRTFFQCVKGTPRVHKCPDDLLFNGKTGICDWKDYVQCIDMSQHYQIDKVCLNAIDGMRYGSFEDNCDSYFICNDGKMKTYKCDQGHKYNVHSEKCDLAANVNCTTAA